MSRAGEPAAFRSAAVLGAGVMGAQIAAHLANAGLHVELLDVASASGPKNAHVESLFARARQLTPPPFFTEEAARGVRLGNFDEHWQRLASVDWIIEAVVEDAQVKRELAASLDGHVRDDAVVSTNTSGLSIAQIADGRSSAFRRAFLGTHFFNPPRYMKLLELVPSAETDPEVIARVSAFARLRLGKGVVVAKDTPNFIANRIGVHAILAALRQMTEGGYTAAEVDALTGPLIGRPKSATLRTCDVVGLDTLVRVADNLRAAVPDDESREGFEVPAVLRTLVAEGALGAKTKRGFYRKEGGRILAFDAARGDWVEPPPPALGDLSALQRVRELGERLRALWQDGGRAGAFFRATTLDLLGYSARRVPEIADSPADIDRAMRWGFGWRQGPFETWEALGFGTVVAALRAREPRVPSWIDEMVRNGDSSFYRERAAARAVYVPGRGWVDEPHAADEISLEVVARRRERVLWQAPQAALLDLGDGVACFVFRSKASTLSAAVMQHLRECLDHVEGGAYRGLVVGNDAEHLSAGANLVELATAIDAGAFDEVDAMVRSFQQTVQRVHEATKPVVLATRGRVLGGACELLMACRHPVAAAESYIGLVETAAGLIPAGGGTMRMLARANARAASPAPAHVEPHLQAAFETLLRAAVSTSAPHAQQLGFLPADATVVMHEDRRSYVAKTEVLRLAAEGYAPPPPREAIPVLGAPARAELEAGLRQLREAGRLDEHAELVGQRLAWVMTGGDREGPGTIGEDELLDLERAAFVALVRTPGTRAKIAAIVG